MEPSKRRSIAAWPWIVVSVQAFAQGNVDTGISLQQCIDTGTPALISCKTTTLPGQDGQIGRDSHSWNNGDGDGRLGASYVRICNTGNRAGVGQCPLRPLLGTGPNDWGCTLDNITGIEYELKTATGFRAASNVYTDYSFDYDPLGLFQSATDATGYVNEVNKQGLCGSNDWGLGHATKLQTVIDYGVGAGQPRLDPSFFPNTVGGPHWDSSANPSSVSAAWAVDYTTGTLDNTGDRGVRRPVVLVRGKPATGITSTYELTKDGNEVVTHSPGSNVTWRRCVEGLAWNGTDCVGTPIQFTLETALLRAKSESLRTGIGWHVPNVKEMAWTIHHENVLPSTDDVEFPDTPVGPYCSSTPDVVTPGQAWIVDLTVGSVYSSSRSISCMLRLVR